jgi:acid phosphatase type 7
MSVRRAARGAVLVAAVLALGSEAGAEPFRKGPYLQNVTERSVTVMWEASSPVPGTVRLLADGRVFESDEAEIHEVVIHGLEAGRRYRYQVECDGEVSEGEFATAPEAGAPFTFVVFGDTRSNAGSHRNVVERVRREIPDFVLGTGDMVDEGGNLSQWQTFFDIERELLRENVLYPSIGNHDRQGRGRTADNFRAFFSLPENSPDPERYYAFTYSNARFLILDSNSYSFALTDQTAWIEQQLQAARLDDRIDHIFVTMHHPPYSIALHGGQEELREAWTPLFDRYGVTAVFSGHDHVYTRAEKHGIRYFVSGGGGAPLYPKSRNPSELDRQAVRYFERVNHYLRVHVIGEYIEVSAIRADGTLIESLSWGAQPRPVEALAQLGRPEPEPPGAPMPARASIAPAAADTGGSFGLLGQLGAGLVVIAAAALVWTLRS